MSHKQSHDCFLQLQTAKLVRDNQIQTQIFDEQSDKGEKISKILARSGQLKVQFKNLQCKVIESTEIPRKFLYFVLLYDAMAIIL